MDKKFFEDPTIYVGEVSLNVTNLERSLEFYRDFLGFKVLEKTKNEAVLTADGKEKLITLVEPENVQRKVAGTTGLFHVAILLPSRKDLAAFLQHLVEKAGDMRLGASDHDVSEALYFSDPDGNGIEVARDRAASEWNWQGDKLHMTTVALDAQGVMSEVEGPWEGMPEDTLIGHMHLHVADIEASRTFLKKGLGYDIVLDMSSALFSSHNGYHHHIAVNQWQGANAQKPAENSVGLNWFSLVFPTEAKRAETVENLRQINAPVEEDNQDYVTEDPAGNRIRLTLA